MVSRSSHRGPDVSRSEPRNQYSHRQFIRESFGGHFEIATTWGRTPHLVRFIYSAMRSYLYTRLLWTDFLKPPLRQTRINNHRRDGQSHAWTSRSAIPRGRCSGRTIACDLTARRRPTVIPVGFNRTPNVLERRIGCHNRQVNVPPVPLCVPEAPLYSTYGK